MKKNNEKQVAKNLAHFANWLSIFDRLNPDIVDLLKVSARNIGSGHELFSLIDNLSKLVETYPVQAGEILKEAITNDVIFYCKKEDIQKFVQTLYEKQAKAVADEICLKLWNKKIFFLKEIYDSNNT